MVLAQTQFLGDLGITQVSNTVINIGLVMLILDSGLKFDVGQWVTWWAGLPWVNSSRWKRCMLSYRSCYIYGTWKSIYSLGEILKSLYWEQATGRGSWPLRTPCKYFNFAIGRGMKYMKWLKDGSKEAFIFHAIMLALGSLW